MHGDNEDGGRDGDGGISIEIICLMLSSYFIGILPF